MDRFKGENISILCDITWPVEGERLDRILSFLKWTTVDRILQILQLVVRTGPITLHEGHVNTLLIWLSWF